MKKVALISLILILALVGCLPKTAEPASDANMATTVAAILTSMPSNTPEPTLPPTPKAVIETPLVLPSDTPAAVEEALPTETAAPTESLEAPTETAEPEEPTDTTEPEDTAEPQHTQVPGDPAADLGKADDSDPMDSAQKWVWPTGKDAYTNNGFKNGYMWLTGLKTLPGWVVSNQSLRDAYVEATFRTEKCTGADSYGLIFHVPVLREADRGYLFALSCDGKYRLWKWDGKVGTKGKATVLIDWTENDAINTGTDNPNRLGVLTDGTKITLYANGVKLGSATDSTYREGYLGVFVTAKQTTNFTVRIEQMRYWKNP